MRKKIISAGGLETSRQAPGDWLDLEQIATIEVSSEDPQFPVERAFDSAAGSGWRAAEPGEQQIRVIFDEPVQVKRIQLRFEETGTERTQEFAIRWLPSTGGPAREILRQRWNFSPTGSTVEVEDYTVDLTGASALELTVQPDLGGGKAVATLASWRIG